MKKSDKKNQQLFPELPELGPLSSSINRRTFIIRNAVIGAAAVMTGTTWTRDARAAQAAKEAAQKSPLPPLDSTSMSPDLNVVKQSKGPVMTVLDHVQVRGHRARTLLDRCESLTISTSDAPNCRRIS